MKTNLNNETFRYIFEANKENEIGKCSFSGGYVTLNQAFVLKALNLDVQIKTNENGRRSATCNGEKFSVSKAEAILKETQNVKVEFSTSEMTEFKFSSEATKTLCEALNDLLAEKIVEKELEWEADKNNLVGKVVYLKEDTWSFREGCGNGIRGMFVKIAERTIRGYLGKSLFNERLVAIRNDELVFTEVVEGEPKEWLESRKHLGTTKPVYVAYQIRNGYRFELGSWRARRYNEKQVELEYVEKSEFPIEYKEENAVWCPEFEYNIEKYLGDEKFRDAVEDYRECREKGFPAIVLDDWHSERMVKKAEIFGELGLPIAYGSNTTNWAEELKKFTEAGFKFGNIVEFIDGGTKKFVIELLY